MGNTSLWGRPFWTFFHCLSINISEIYYTSIKIQLMAHFKALCALLPCPECASHATEYLKKCSVPPTVNDYRKFLLVFHNSVNARTNKPPFLFEQLIIYKNAPLYHLFKCFELSYMVTTYNPNMITYNLSKKNNMENFKKWCHQNKIFTTKAY